MKTMTQEIQSSRSISDTVHWVWNIQDFCVIRYLLVWVLFRKYIVLTHCQLGLP